MSEEQNPIEETELTEDQRKTRHLVDPDEAATPMRPRMTGPLDGLMPWVIEFRVVGTTNLIKVPVRDKMLIGRPDPKNGITPEINLVPYGAHMMGVSRQHAMVRTINNRVTVEDLESANGTYINEHILEPSKEYRIRDQDILRLGRLQLQVHFVVKPLMVDETHVGMTNQFQIPKIGNGQRILIVDEDRTVTELISLVLRQAGFRVVVKHTVTESLNYIDDTLPDAVLTELVLPDMNGLELVRYTQEKTQGLVPVMVVSSATGGYQMGQAMENGVEVVLGKPVAIDELLEKIGKLFNK